MINPSEVIAVAPYMLVRGTMDNFVEFLNHVQIPHTDNIVRSSFAVVFVYRDYVYKLVRKQDGYNRFLLWFAEHGNPYIPATTVVQQDDHYMLLWQERVWSGSYDPALVRDIRNYLYDVVDAAHAGNAVDFALADPDLSQYLQDIHWFLADNRAKITDRYGKPAAAYTDCCTRNVGVVGEQLKLFDVLDFMLEE